MKNPLSGLITVVLLVSSLPAIAQQQPLQSKPIPHSINYMWKMVEGDFTALAKRCEEKWTFKPTQGAFTDVRSFAEEVKHVACANEAWAKRLRGRNRQPSATLVGRIRQGQELTFWLTCANHLS